MSNKEKLYHWINVVAILVTALSGILLIRMGYIADADQISMSTSIMSMFSVLLMIITSVGVIWIVVSGLINKNLKAMVAKGAKGIFKSYAGMVVLFIILMVLSLFTLLWVIGLMALAIYLFVTSSKVLITNVSPKMV